MFRRFLTVVAACLSLNAFAAVDVNQASRADLETVKGIGPALSGKILEARSSGPFKNWSDLVDRVGGVGPGNAARFSQAGLTVAGTTFDGAPAAATAAPKKTRAAKTADEAAPAKARPDGKADAAEPASKPAKAVRPAA